MRNNKLEKFERAQSRVAKIKGFYHHVFVFVLFSGLLLLMRGKMTEAIFGEAASYNSKAMDWVDWNLYLWGVILVIHALLVFGKIPLFVKKWEEREIEKYMDSSITEIQNDNQTDHGK